MKDVIGTRTILLLMCGVALGSPLSVWLIHALQTAPLGPFWFPLFKGLLLLEMPLSLLWLAVALAGPFYFVYIAMRGLHRERHIPCLLLCLFAWASLGLSFLGSESVRHLHQHWLSIASERAQPIVRALERYKVDTGVYPTQLFDLAPRYLSSIPSTGMAGYPTFKYVLPCAQNDVRSYELRVDTPQGALDWDCFVYWPEGNYPAEMYGGSVDRIGDWAYVNE